MEYKPNSQMTQPENPFQSNLNPKYSNPFKNQNSFFDPQGLPGNLLKLQVV